VATAVATTAAPVAQARWMRALLLARDVLASESSSSRDASIDALLAVLRILCCVSLHLLLIDFSRI
jgi:hypothetical protein